MLFKRLRKVLFYVTSFLFVVITTALALCYFYGTDLPSELTLLNYTPPTTTRIFNRTGELVEEYAIEHRVIADFSEIPMIIKGAFIIAEDREFYNHAGISIQSLIRAIIENTANKSWTKKPAGGSTITQQIAKNLLVGNARTLSRKIREAIMAFRIESTIPKDKILEIYLNQLYLGKGCYGICEACNYYFGKELNQIEPHEAAFLAAIPSAPTVYINDKGSTKLLMKKNSIIYQMYEMGYINKEQMKDSINKPVEIRDKKYKLYAPYFSDEIFRMVTHHISKNDFFRNGYSIKSTLDKETQRAAQKALEDGIIAYTKTTRWKGVIGNIKDDHKLDLRVIESQLPTNLNEIKACIVKSIKGKNVVCKGKDKETIVVTLDEKCYPDAKLKDGDVVLCRKIKKDEYELYQTPEITGGIIVMDSKTGDVLALSGGFSSDLTSFNCITQAIRQPGSTIKPFVYAAALENGKDEYDIIEDKPVTITLKSGEKYSPHNYNGKVYGETYLRDGVIYSRNLSTINMAREIGMKKISELLKSMNLTKKNIPISAVLGSVEVTPIQLITAFSAFFNDGKMVFPRFIIELKQRNHSIPDDVLKSILFRHQDKEVLSKKTAESMKNILHDVVVYGTANSIHELEEMFHIKLFGKTGTTNDFKDAWFLGAIEKGDKTLLVCTFMGYSIPKSMGEHQTGARVALPIFANFVRERFRND